MPTFPVDANGACFADSFMSNDVLGRPGGYALHGGSQSSAVKSNLYTSRCVGGPAPGSFSPPRTPQTASMINPTSSASNTPGWQQGQVLDAPRDTMNMPLGWDEHSEAQSEEPHSETPHAQSHGTTIAEPGAPQKKKRDQRENNQKAKEKRHEQQQQAARVPGLEARIQDLES